MTLEELLKQPMGAGNIDLTKRPIVNNSDGSLSTVRSMSANIDGSEVLLPTVSEDGRIMSDDEAINTYLKTGRHLGKFKTPEEANAYAEKLHVKQESMYKPNFLEELLRQGKSFGQGASNAAASTVTGPVDMLAWLLRKGGVDVGDAPVGSEEWMRRHGFMVTPENRMAGLLGEGAGLAVPIVAAGKMKKGLLK